MTDRARRRVLAGAVAGAAATAAWATVVERNWFALRHVTVPALRDTAAAPLRILHVSDLHLVPGQKRKRAFVRGCARLAPDLVVATGDFLGRADAVEPAVETMAALGTDRPAVAVLGSNDRFQPRMKNPLGYFRGPNPRVDGPRMDTERLAEGLAAAGWRLVDNRRGLVDTAAGVLDVAGLGDPHIGLDDPRRVDWAQPDTDVALRLGVVHAPYLRALDVFDRHGYDLVLSGHTHGGQVRVPGVGALVANCDLPLSQARGLSRHGADLWLHVSAGLGTSPYAPVRLACRPEATLVDIVPGAAASR